MPNGEKADELLAGVPVNFRAYIKNSGDAALDDLQYHVTVYNSQAGGVRGDIAQDNNGNDLAVEQQCSYLFYLSTNFTSRRRLLDHWSDFTG